MSERPRSRQLLAPLLLAVGSACTGHVGVVVTNPVTFVPEVEPNDNLWTAQDMGLLSAYETIVVEGYVEDSPFDPYDGFAFHIPAPCRLEILLESHVPGADLAFSVVDPYTGIEVAEFQSFQNPEYGEVIVYGPIVGSVELHLVVTSYFGASSYTFEVSASPLLAAMADGDDPEVGSIVAPGREPGGRLDGYLGEPAAADEDDDQRAPLFGQLLELGPDGEVLDAKLVLFDEERFVEVQRD